LEPPPCEILNVPLTHSVIEIDAKGRRKATGPPECGGEGHNIYVPFPKITFVVHICAHDTVV